MKKVVKANEKQFKIKRKFPFTFQYSVRFFLPVLYFFVFCIFPFAWMKAEENGRNGRKKSQSVPKGIESVVGVPKGIESVAEENGYKKSESSSPMNEVYPYPLPTKTLPLIDAIRENHLNL